MLLQDKRLQRKYWGGLTPKYFHPYVAQGLTAKIHKSWKNYSLQP